MINGPRLWASQTRLLCFVHHPGGDRWPLVCHFYSDSACLPLLLQGLTPQPQSVQSKLYFQLLFGFWLVLYTVIYDLHFKNLHLIDRTLPSYNLSASWASWRERKGGLDKWQVTHSAARCFIQKCSWSKLSCHLKGLDEEPLSRTGRISFLSLSRIQPF